MMVSEQVADCRAVSMFSQLSKAANIEEIHRELLDLKVSIKQWSYNR